MKKVIDKTGCCAVSKLICDKSKCPPKPPQCTEAFHIMEKTQTASDKICCDIFECREYPRFWHCAFSCRLSLDKLTHTHTHAMNVNTNFRSTTEQMHCNDKWEKDTEKYGRDMDDGGCLR